MPILETNWNPGRRQLRQFAVLQFVFFCIVAAVLYRSGTSPGVLTAIAAVSALAGVIGYVYTPFLRVIYLAWMAAVFPIGFVMSYLVMGVAYYLVVTPVGLLMRLCGHNSMHPRFDRQASTYWVAREPSTDTKRYFRQY